MATATVAGQNKTLYAGLGAICGALLLGVLLLLNRGIDLTDEGAYLNSIATPDLYPNSLSLFGFFYHPLLEVSAYNILALRMFNYAVLVGLTSALAIRATYATGLAPSLNGLGKFGLWGAFTTSALFFYCIWLPTPSYNSLNVSGALLFAYAVIGISSDRFSIWDVLIAGLALAICALAKPTTGAVLAGILLIFTFRARAAYVYAVIATILFSAVIYCAFVLAVYGSPGAAIQAFHQSLLLAQGLVGTQSPIDIYLWRSFPFPLELLYIFLVGAIAAISFLVTEFRFRLGSRALPSWLGVFSGLLAICIWVQFYTDWWNRPLNWTPTLFAGVIMLGKMIQTRSIHAHHLRIMLILMAIPIAVGLGSNTGMLRSAAQAAAIWAIASLFILTITLDRENLRIYATQVAVSSLIAAAVMTAWVVYFPQRQVAPLWTQQTWISAHGREQALQVDSGTAAYFRKLASAAQANGFSDKTDVIDLTGMSPATIYVLGGNALGSSYFSGGWFWSEWLVDRLLKPIPRARLARAWVMTRAPASDTINPRVLSRLGVNFPADYMPVGHAVPLFEGGEETLWKPKSQDRPMLSPRPD